jgi:hypothetical protein
MLHFTPALLPTLQSSVRAALAAPSPTAASVAGAIVAVTDAEWAETALELAERALTASRDARLAPHLDNVIEMFFYPRD